MAKRGMSDTRRDWWTPRQPWPDGVHFEDGPTERILDHQMPARPVQAGDYGSTGLRCLDSPLAGIGYLLS